MSGIATGRLAEERKNWRKDHPPGFYARPAKNADGSCNLMEWECGVPGRAGTDWESGVYVVKITFTEEYPSKPPSCRFTPAIFHPNIFSSGQVCLSILKEEKGWRPAITIKQVLMGLQDLLDNPEPRDPANGNAAQLMQKNPTEYKRQIRAQAAKFVPST
jgi:ubiquitin-conjugating enzyme E2 I